MASRPTLLALLGLVLLSAGCGSTSGPRASRMSFASMQAINPGVEGDWILGEYPYARSVDRRPDGSLQSLRYMVDDPLGKSRALMLYFDERGVLARKQYAGPLVRPPDPQSVNFGIRQSPSGTPAPPPPPRNHPDWTPAGYSQSGGQKR